MRTDEIKLMLGKFYNGDSSLDEEAALRKFFKSASIPEELREDAEIFAMYEAMGKEDIVPEPGIMPNESSGTKSRSLSISWLSGIAASVALLLTGILLGSLFFRNSIDTTEITALRHDVQDMKKMVVLNQLEKESVSERIMATYTCMELDSAGDEILNALINTFQNDENANVKNAAADALFKFGNNEKVRKAFINALTNESDPILQIKLIDMLVDLQEKRALPVLQKVIQEKDKMVIVKDKAA